MEGINLNDVAKKYNEIPVIWDERDKWHNKTKKMINDFITRSLKSIHNYNGLKILNAGSGGNNYGLPESTLTHIDIAAEKIKGLNNSIQANIENMPIKEEMYDLIICVGSVINYCDPLKVIQEFKRVIKPGGKIILEFENSHTLELIFKKEFNKKVVLVNTFYNQRPETVWYFSEKFIKEIITENKFEIAKIERCHILSPLVYWLTKKETFSAFFSKMDFFLE